MNPRALLIGLLVLLAVPAPDRILALGANPEVDRTVSLVRQAASLLRTTGEAAFAQFRRSGSPFFSGESYVFVVRADGVAMCNPSNPQREGKNIRSERDSDGRSIFDLLMAATRTVTGEGWAHYLWPRPTDRVVAWKASYVQLVRTPGGARYLVGSGLYTTRLHPSFIVDVVARAAYLLEREGTKAFTALRDPKGEFRFLDAYVFVIREDGVELVNPAQPALEGKNQLGLKDAQGQPVVRQLIDLVKKAPDGWITYEWNPPGEHKPSAKVTFARRVLIDGRLCCVGSGYYPSR